ncbi:unnamed protein product [Echinostoma caproni]|uniref:Pept_C1 domain-containing protein n=1 Tax=Echinostoma caproni TaxID=27848 RepID=A0A183A5E4_9TREM|nr:unnamed protein product [Echinostoma caproni]
MLLHSAIVLLLLHTTLATDYLGGPRSWEEWKLKYGKTYNNEDHDFQRKNVWLANARRVAKHNKRYEQGLESYYLRLNQFADMTWAEFNQTYLYSRRPEQIPSDPVQIPFKTVGKLPPDAMDWVHEKCVTGVKTQGKCQSSWAFATAGAIECQYALASKKLITISAQQLIDCSTPYHNHGCNGGSAENAYRYLNKNPIESEESYPYTGKDGKCEADEAKGLAMVKLFYGVYSGSEEELKALVGLHGPTVAEIDADEDFMLYGGGIYYSFKCKRDSPNLSILLVGYKWAAFHDYWLAKTSLGPDYGEEGYVKIARGFFNMCGIANYASLPILKNIQ